MTEMAPLGTAAHLPAGRWPAHRTTSEFGYRAKQGRPAPFVEIRARNEDGLVPWDGKTMGELEVRGPWIAQRVLQPRRLRRSLHRRRLVQDRRHRDDRRDGDDPGAGSHEGPDQVGRRVDQLGRARVRADGPPGRGRSGGDPGDAAPNGASGRWRPWC